METVLLEDARALGYVYAEKSDPKYELAAREYLARWIVEERPSLEDIAAPACSFVEKQSMNVSWRATALGMNSRVDLATKPIAHATLSSKVISRRVPEFHRSTSDSRRGSPRNPLGVATCYIDSMSTELVASAGVIDAIRERGGALYVWPRKARCCGGTITLEAATEPPDKEFRRVEATGINLFVPAGMVLPDSLHVEISRRGRIRAFWNGLAWVETAASNTDPSSLPPAPPPQDFSLTPQTRG